MRSLILLLGYYLIAVSCDGPTGQNDEKLVETPATTISMKDRSLSPAFKKYWYDGVAEISSYDLKQTRYGELREGTAVLIYVTEPFDVKDQIKADEDAPTNQSVLKLNATRDFLTGIYPYSIMSSTFLPLEQEQNALKVATSIQEWCGHTYMQLNLRNGNYEGQLYSYFQSEGNTSFTVDAVILENQIPMQLRLDPQTMPTGEIAIIPSTEHLRLMHKPTKVHQAVASLKLQNSSYLYEVIYDTGRTLRYQVDQSFPYQITQWTETFDYRGKTAIVNAQLKKTLRTPYWDQNSNQYSILRDSLEI